MDVNQNSEKNPYQAFDRLSEELFTTYFGLADRVAGLESELARSRQEKEQQREEKTHLAERLSGLLEALPGGVVVHDSNGLVSCCNAAARRWFGAALQGRSWTEQLASGKVRLLDEGRELEMSDGTQLKIARRFLPGRQETIILLTDVTEERSLQAALAQSRRLATMGEMAARLAHQLRTPLSTAMLYANHLTESDLEASQRQEFGGKLVARLRDLERLTRDMLGFVRDTPSNPREFELEDLFDSVRQTLDGALRGGKSLNLRECDVDGVVRGDLRALAGALCNLIENAWQVGGDSVSVDVSARRTGDGSVEIRVQDNGPGIDGPLRGRIFEPFFSARKGGTGLGLPLARSVAEAHQGAVYLEPTTLEGACFIIRLPLHPHVIEQAPMLALAGDAG